MGNASASLYRRPTILAGRNGVTVEGSGKCTLACVSDQRVYSLAKAKRGNHVKQETSQERIARVFARGRAKRQIPRLDAWPEISEGPKIQGFAGYKAGMTHAFIVDFRSQSTTAGQEVKVPVTVLEVPPMKMAAVQDLREHPLRPAGPRERSGRPGSTRLCAACCPSPRK